MRQTGGVEFLARNGKDQITRIDQDGQYDRNPFGLQPLSVLVHVLHALVILDQLGPVHHLAVPFLLEQAEDVFGVFRFVGVEPFTVEQFQGIEHRRGLLGAILAGDGAQGILRGLVPVMSNREKGIFGASAVCCW